MSQDGGNFDPVGFGGQLPPQLSQMTPEQMLAAQMDPQNNAQSSQGGDDSQLAPVFNEKDLVRKTGRQRIIEFLKNHQCFDLLRTSGKVVVFDTSIPIQLAFYALVEHEMECAPLWDSASRRFQGLMTISDYIHVVRSTSSAGQQDRLARRTIQETLDAAEGQRMKQDGGFAACTVEQTLHAAAAALAQQRVKFLPLVTPDGAAVMACVNEVDVLDYLVATFREQRRLFEDSISSLNIGTYNNVCTVSQDQRLRDVLATLERYDIQTVPVVDAGGAVRDVYAHSDFTFLAQATDPGEVEQQLDMQVGEVLRGQRQRGAPNRLHTCSPQDTLQAIFELFAEVRFRVLVCVDAEQRCVGIVSVHDLLSYFTD
mmetsp:Transcript_12431/g.19101  ORF Transcript_12431/g.19101 Transcript_12431/m.19101 type:complete len:370 (-) Transcript_12431:288-1397(-)